MNLRYRLRNWWFWGIRLPLAYWRECARYALSARIRAIRDARRFVGSRFGAGWLPVYDVGPGWRRVVARLEADLFRVGWGGEIHQVKEKSGGLRFYCSSDGEPAIWYAIVRAEDECARTCERCGGRGKLQNGGWATTTCDGCAVRPKVRP